MLLSILLWVVAVFLAWSVLLLIGSIGKPRKPSTPAVAVIGVCMYVPVIAVVVTAALTVAP